MTFSYLVQLYLEIQGSFLDLYIFVYEFLIKLCIFLLQTFDLLLILSFEPLKRTL